MKSPVGPSPLRLDATITLRAGSTATPTMSSRPVFSPLITRFGATFPFASLANTEILGTLTQLGTRISSRFESYAAADALVKPQVGVFTGAFLTIRFGFTLPVAVRGNTTAVWSP